MSPSRQAHSWSLARQLALWCATSAFALVLGAIGYLYWALEQSLKEENIAFLADQVGLLKVILRDRPDDPAALRQEVELEAKERKRDKIYIRILDERGQPSMETPGMSEVLPINAFPPVSGLDPPAPGVRELRSPKGKLFWARVERAPAGGSGSLVRIIQAALDRKEERNLLAGFRRRIFPALGFALGLAVFVGYRIARRGMRPVLEVSEMARRVRSTTLNRRIDPSGFPAEIADLAVTMNGMFDRLEESFAKLSRFSSDIAHELRTPLGNLRGEVEVALGNPKVSEESRDAFASCLEEIERLSSMIDSLLFLARTENGSSEIKRQSVDLARECELFREYYGASADEAGIVLSAAIAKPISVELDRALFQRAVGNLLENALAYTPAGGGVHVMAVQSENVVTVSVSDTGCGIASEHLPNVFDRFYRVDSSRSAHTGGVGLGLAIVKSIAELHGGTVRIASTVGRGTEVTLVFPRENGSTGSSR